MRDAQVQGISWPAEQLSFIRSFLVAVDTVALQIVFPVPPPPPSSWSQAVENVPVWGYGQCQGTPFLSTSLIIINYWRKTLFIQLVLLSASYVLLYKLNTILKQVIKL
jgi:hypothetical protein